MSKSFIFLSSYYYFINFDFRVKKLLGEVMKELKEIKEASAQDKISVTKAYRFDFQFQQ
jgi:hypothetical protein